MNNEAIKDLLYKMADDELIMGHRMSEWCGTAPLLEEDLAFSSIAQDKLGHSLQNFKFLQELGETDPDTNGFKRSADKFHCCQLVQLPIDDYAFSLVRQFLFDNAEFIRYKMLQESSYEPLAKFAGKAVGELRYHILHADQWIKKLGTSTNEAKAKMQAAFDKAMPYALGIFEESKFEEDLISMGLFKGEVALKEAWKSKIDEVMAETDFKHIYWDQLEAKTGGRYGQHTEHLAPLLEEMGEVINSQPASVDW